MTDENRRAEAATPLLGDKARVPADVPSIYADQIVDVIYGIYTSKVVFGVEEGGSSGVRPVATVVVPSAVLMMACLRIANDITAPPMIAETSSRFDDILKNMRQIGGFLAQDPPPTGDAKKPTENP